MLCYADRLHGCATADADATMEHVHKLQQNVLHRAPQNLKMPQAWFRLAAVLPKACIHLVAILLHPAHMPVAAFAYEAIGVSGQPRRGPPARKSPTSPKVQLKSPKAHKPISKTLEQLFPKPTKPPHHGHACHGHSFVDMATCTTATSCVVLSPLLGFSRLTVAVCDDSQGPMPLAPC